MRDAFGGIFNIATIVVFITLVSGFLAFNVNYTKAFRVKNKIISTIEEYEGSCSIGSDCDIKISSYMSELGYSSPSNNYCEADYNFQNGYCISNAISSGTSDNKKVYYKVETAIVIDIPIVNKLLPKIRIFRVGGSTRSMVVR